MKTRIAIVAVALLIAVQAGFSKTPTKRFPTLESKVEYAKKNMNIALHMGNAGVIESALRMTAQIKMKFQDTDVSDLKEMINEMAINHPSAAIRYKAYIASEICSDPQWYALDQNVVTADQEHFFPAAAKRLQQKLLSSTY